MIIMVNNTDERPVNPLAARNWDLRQREKANEASKQAAIKEVTKASRQAGRDSRTGMVESGLVNTKKERKSGSW